MTELVLSFYQDWFPPIVLVGIGIAHRSKSCLRGQGIKAFHSLVINIWRCLSIDLRCNKDNLKSSSSFITLVWRRKVNCQARVDTCLELFSDFCLEIDKRLRAVYFCSGKWNWWIWFSLTWPGWRSDWTRRCLSSFVRAISWLSCKTISEVSFFFLLFPLRS